MMQVEPVKAPTPHVFLVLKFEEWLSVILMLLRCVCLGVRGSLMFNVTASWLTCHEFEPSAAENLPCRGAVPIKSVESSNVLPWNFESKYRRTFTHKYEDTSGQKKSGRPPTIDNPTHFSERHFTSNISPTPTKRKSRRRCKDCFSKKDANEKDKEGNTILIAELVCA
ncbi:hypothetical protein TNCV_3603921 [Trichonephila clavipes]|nr:hypothetical protein TNCV_3603921 [Trichonephila clavipes]